MTAVVIASCSPTGSAAAAGVGRKRRTATTTTTPTTVLTATTLTVPTTATTTTMATTTTTRKAATGNITVFAAASLSAAFTDLANAFERANPGARVTNNFAGSSTLVTQILNGAPADVFASADIANMDKLIKAKAVDDTPTIFTRNKLMIVVPKGNPLRVKTLADLGRDEVVVALGAPGVPVGDYARQILAAAGVTVSPKTLESSVSAIVSKAALKEIDAGIVYVTDVAIDEYRVDGVAIPDKQNIVAEYPIATLESGNNKSTASAFVAFCRSNAAQAILKRYRFLPL